MPRGQPPSKMSEQKLRTQTARTNRYVDEANAGDATNYNREVARENKLVGTQAMERALVIKGRAGALARGRAAVEAAKPPVYKRNLTAIKAAGGPLAAAGKLAGKLVGRGDAEAGARKPTFAEAVGGAGRVSANVEDRRLPLIGAPGARGEEGAKGRPPKKRPRKK